MYNTGEHEAPASRWLNILSIPVLLVIGWILYELTAQPALGVAAICVKFGWEDFRTAWWLRRNDADWRRGRATFWLYLASGLWKMAITASLMIFGYIFLKMMGALGPRAGPHVAGALLTAFAGISLATVTACWAVFLAFIWRVRLWLNSATHYARRHNLWPPPPAPANAHNAAGLLICTSLFAMLVPLLVFGLVLGVLHSVGLNNGGPGELILLAGLPGIALVLVLSLFFLSRRVLGPRIYAASAQECWKKVPVVERKEQKEPVELYVGEEVEASRGASWGGPRLREPGA
jgi:hypothetical protein